MLSWGDNFVGPQRLPGWRERGTGVLGRRLGPGRSSFHCPPIAEIIFLEYTIRTDIVWWRIQMVVLI